jgi:cytochrome c oxidase cbb3-type subunit III
VSAVHSPEEDPNAPERHGPPTFDGIRELDSNPPRIWTYVYIVTFGAAIWLFVAYPAIPWFSGATTGVFDWSSRADLARAVNRADAAAPDVAQRFAAAGIEDIEADPALRAYAIAGGHAAWGTNCAPCHGRDGAGAAAGYPNLRDKDWLWGGTPEAIQQTLQVGIRWPGEDETRVSQMPAFGAMRMLERRAVQDLVEQVRALSGQEHDATAAERGAPVFAEQCASCHGEGGEGNPAVGAPRLSDDVWLYGGGRKELYETIWNSRSGVMPAFGHRLTEDTIRKLVVYVRSFGGGE